MIQQCEKSGRDGRDDGDGDWRSALITVTVTILPGVTFIVATVAIVALNQGHKTMKPDAPTLMPCFVFIFDVILFLNQNI